MPQYFAEGESYRVIIGDGRCANLLVILMVVVVGSGGIWKKSRLTGSGSCWPELHFLC